MSCPAEKRVSAMIRVSVLTAFLLAGLSCFGEPGNEERAFEKVPPNAAGDEALVGGVNPWHYWGSRFEPKRQLVAQEWRESDDVIDGWDWSLPTDRKSVV